MTGRRICLARGPTPPYVARTDQLTAPWLDRPVDLAGTSREDAARNFASNTVLGGGSDLYVLNRGDNTIVQERQALLDFLNVICGGRRAARESSSGR